MAFASADTLIPDPSNPLDWNRYLYVGANPINRDDPTGHAQRCPDGTCGAGGSTMDELRKARERAKNKPTNLERTVIEKATEGDIISIIDLIMPSHLGIRMHGELSIPIISPATGISLSSGTNIVYNGPDHKLAINWDYAIEPGFGSGIGGSLMEGPLIGWVSSNIEDVTTGNSSVLSASAADGFAATISVSAPQEGSTPLDLLNLHVDPHYGQVPVTLYFGVGAGGVYGGVNGGFSQSLLYGDYTAILPNWSIFDK